MLWRKDAVLQAFSNPNGTRLACIIKDMRANFPIRAFIAVSLVAAVLGFSFSTVQAEQGGLPVSEICERHIAEAEKYLDIPSQLLLAIAMVESGVWNATRDRSTAWPWTVYAQQQGRRFASKSEALARVR